MFNRINIKITGRVFALSCLLILAGCNKEWEGEQYEKYISFVNNGAVAIRLKYEPDGGNKTYRVPVQVSGSTMPKHDINVTLALDPDTLVDYNFQRFRYRDDLYFRELQENYYDLSSWSTVIPAETSRGYVDIEFNMEGLDLYYDYMLPLQIDPSSELPANPRKHYKKTLMYLSIFNDYSGTYNISGTLEEVNDQGERVNDDEIKVESRYTRVVDENTIFFYAGVTDEEALDRKEYQVFAEFIPGDDEFAGHVKLTCKNPDIDFRADDEACIYVIQEEEDAVQPYLVRRTTTVILDYSYLDVRNPEYILRYRYKGPMVMQRTFNNLMPEEDRIIW